jgi:nitrogen-specific signal transduction histidine kinase
MIEAVRARQKLREAIRKVAGVAAQWQEAGVDTEPLNLPIIQVQEAIAELDAIDLESEAARRLAVLARELRNHFNGVRVSGAGLETEDNPAKRLRWLELIEQEADGCVCTIDRMWPLMSDEEAQGTDRHAGT